MPIGDRSLGPGGWMRPPTERFNWRRFLESKNLKIALAAFTVIALVLGSLYIYSRIERGHAKPPESRPQVVETAPKPQQEAKGTEVSLPVDLGGHVNSESLVKLLNAAHQYDLNPGRVQLTLQGRARNHAPVFPVGESFKVKISSPSECYYGLIHHNSDGTFQLLVPQLGSESAASAKLRAGVTEVLTVHATPPGGQQEFILICAQRPIDLQRVLVGPQEAYGQSFSAVVVPYDALEARLK